MQHLLKDLDAERVGQIVVYKIDRLSRSLSDFSKIVDMLEKADASFVSVTQSFNTAASMGRLTLNMLLSFAQFERYVAAERIRDKTAASKRKGLWMGGNVPLGYDPDGRTLTINAEEAKTVRTIYDLHLEHGTVHEVKEQAAALGLRTKQRVTKTGKRQGGIPFGRGHLYQIPSNPIYAGNIRHHKNIFDGQHPAIIDPDIWEEVQQRFAAASSRVKGKSNAAHPSPLSGKLFDETGDRLTPSHANKNGKRLRYYISRRLVVDKCIKHPDAWHLPAPQLEQAIAQAVGKSFGREGILPDLVEDLKANEVGCPGNKPGSLARVFSCKKRCRIGVT